MNAPQELTDIQRFYKNGTVFLTGATGFIGKLVLEKVLRALPVTKVFILVRKKKEVLPEKRFQDIFESPAFDILKRSDPNALNKVFLMEGDCSLPKLGLSQRDQETLIEEVNIIFHVAATVRFDEALKKAVFTNIRGTKDLITLAQHIKKLKTFVYVGTGFSNCNRTEIKERIYPAKIAAEKLITACESLDDECLKSMTKTLIGDWPNTYTFSKQVTEDYINRKGRDIPICIVRPSIVVSTLSEPLVAFVDNVFTLAGFVLANGLGLSRISYYKNTSLDIVPADFVVNECIAAGWQTGESFKPYKTELPIYHVSSVMENPIKQDDVYHYCEYYARQVPSKKVVLYPLYFRTTCRYNYLFWRMIFHDLMAYIFDLLLTLKGKQPMYAGVMAKLHKFQEAMEHFTTHPIFLHMDNTRKILRKMSFKDKELFNFDVTTINWVTYFSQYCKGLRSYLLKDPIHTVPEGVKHYTYLKRVFILSLIIIAIILYAVGKLFIFKLVPLLFGMVLHILKSTVC